MKHKTLKKGDVVLCEHKNKVFSEKTLDNLVSAHLFKNRDVILIHSRDVNVLLSKKDISYNDKPQTLDSNSYMLAGRSVVNINGVLYYSGFFHKMEMIKRRSIF